MLPLLAAPATSCRIPSPSTPCCVAVAASPLRAWCAASPWSSSLAAAAAGPLRRPRRAPPSPARPRPSRPRRRQGLRPPVVLQHAAQLANAPAPAVAFLYSGSTALSSSPSSACRPHTVHFDRQKLRPRLCPAASDAAGLCAPPRPSVGLRAGAARHHARACMPPAAPLSRCSSSGCASPALVLHVHVRQQLPARARSRHARPASYRQVLPAMAALSASVARLPGRPRLLLDRPAASVCSVFNYLEVSPASLRFPLGRGRSTQAARAHAMAGSARSRTHSSMLRCLPAFAHACVHRAS